MLCLPEAPTGGVNSVVHQVLVQRGIVVKCSLHYSSEII